MAIERASGQRSTVEHQEGYTFFNWDKYSAYGINFTKIRDSGWSYYHNPSGRNIAKKFYEKCYNNSPEFRFIKLHGSCNWYKYSNYCLPDILINSNKVNYQNSKIPKSLQNEIICFNGDWQFGRLPTWSNSNTRLLEPIIIPPVLVKENELRKDIFKQLWYLAKKSLLQCEEIIFIGYSFPDTDIDSKRLFIEVFSEKKDIEVTLINPDRSIENKFRELVNFRGTITSAVDSGDFIRNFRL